MRTLGWIVAILVNGALAVAFLPGVTAPDVPIMTRLLTVLVVTGLATAVLFLLMARLRHVPSWLPRAMRYLCLSFPILWLVGSLDHGIVSGLELLSVVAIALLAWGTWHVFRLFQRQA